MYTLYIYVFTSIHFAKRDTTTTVKRKKLKEAQSVSREKK